MRKRYISLGLLCLMLLPAGLLSSAEDANATLEARVLELEARVAELQAQVEALVAQQEQQQDTPVPFSMNQPQPLGGALTVTITGYETGTRFRYYPAGGFSTSTLSARTGYRLLLLTLRVENTSGGDAYVSPLVSAQIAYGSDYTAAARDTFFYLASPGAYAGGLKTIGAQTAVDGCLLFAVPEGVDGSDEAIRVTFTVDGAQYACTLRAGSGLKASGEEAAF